VISVDHFAFCPGCLKFPVLRVKELATTADSGTANPTRAQGTRGARRGVILAERQRKCRIRWGYNLADFFKGHKLLELAPPRRLSDSLGLTPTRPLAKIGQTWREFSATMKKRFSLTRAVLSKSTRPRSKFQSVCGRQRFRSKLAGANHENR
jgi:hypothetical protein